MRILFSIYLLLCLSLFSVAQNWSSFQSKPTPLKTLVKGNNYVYGFTDYFIYRKTGNSEWEAFSAYNSNPNYKYIVEKGDTLIGLRGNNLYYITKNSGDWQELNLYSGSRTNNALFFKDHIWTVDEYDGLLKFNIENRTTERPIYPDGLGHQYIFVMDACLIYIDDNVVYRSYDGHNFEQIIAGNYYNSILPYWTHPEFTLLRSESGQTYLGSDCMEEVSYPVIVPPNPIWPPNYAYKNEVLYALFLKKNSNSLRFFSSTDQGQSFVLHSDFADFFENHTLFDAIFDGENFLLCTSEGLYRILLPTLEIIPLGMMLREPIDDFVTSPTSLWYKSRNTWHLFDEAAHQWIIMDWENITTNTPNGVMGIANFGNGVIAYDNRFSYYSEDAGKSWALIKNASGGNATRFSAEAKIQTDIIIDYESQYQLYYRTPDDSTWKELLVVGFPNEPEAPQTKIFYQDGKWILLKQVFSFQNFSTTNTFYLSMDNAETWQEIYDFPCALSFNSNSIGGFFDNGFLVSCNEKTYFWEKNKGFKEIYPQDWTSGSLFRSSSNPPTVFMIDSMVVGQHFNGLYRMYDKNGRFFPFFQNMPTTNLLLTRFDGENLCLSERNSIFCTKEFGDFTKDKQAHSLRIFPNPVSDKMHIAADNLIFDPTMRLHIYSVQGILVAELPFEPGDEWEFDLAMLPQGMYYAKVQYGEEFWSSKFVKMK